MVHGWPDTYRLWDAQVELLKSRYRCIRFTLPVFDRERLPRSLAIDELMAFLLRVVTHLSPGRKVTLMLHDWGCAFGYEFYTRHPELVSRIVGVDIGDSRGLARSWSAREKFMVMAYQMWLALAWKIGGPLGDWMTLKMARWIGWPADGRYVSSCMTYPYYLAWFGGDQAYRKHMHRFKPACPVLFLYGKRKLFMFHTQAWIDELRTREGNQVVEFDTGHWVMLQDPKRFNQVVGDWLTAT